MLEADFYGKLLPTPSGLATSPKCVEMAAIDIHSVDAFGGGREGVFERTISCPCLASQTSEVSLKGYPFVSARAQQGRSMLQWNALPLPSPNAYQQSWHQNTAGIWHGWNCNRAAKHLEQGARRAGRAFRARLTNLSAHIHNEDTV
jgi:hypothetical protein